LAEKYSGRSRVFAPSWNRAETPTAHFRSRARCVAGRSREQVGAAEGAALRGILPISCGAIGIGVDFVREELPSTWSTPRVRMCRCALRVEALTSASRKSDSRHIGVAVADALAWLTTLDLGRRERRSRSWCSRDHRAHGVHARGRLSYLCIDRRWGRCRAGRVNAFVWRRRLAQACPAFSTSSTSLRSDCTRATMPLLESLRRLTTAGNSVLVVEHDADTILAADHVVDMGGCGRNGGYIVAEERHPSSRGMRRR